MRPVLKERRAADDAVHLVALLEQQLGQVGAVLTRDSGDQRSLHEARHRPASVAPEPPVPLELAKGDPGHPQEQEPWLTTGTWNPAVRRA